MLLELEILKASALIILMLVARVASRLIVQLLRPTLAPVLLTPRNGQNHTFIGIYGEHSVLLAGKLPYIRSYT